MIMEAILFTVMIMEAILFIQSWLWKLFYSYSHDYES